MGERSGKALIEGEVFAENLRQLMAYADLHGERALASPEELEGTCGVSRSNIYRYLGLETSPTLEKLERIARAYGLLVWQLLTPGLDPSNPPVVFVTPAEHEFYARVRSVGEQARKLEGGGIETAVGSAPDADRTGPSPTQTKPRKRPGRPRKVRFP